MKKFFLIIGIFACLCGCTKQQFARKVGGTITIELPVGEELMEATWKANDLFYLTRPMSADYVPVTKHFRENSSWGVLESEVIFVETR